jgi:hypothetical protein
VCGESGEFKNYRDYAVAVNNEFVIVPMIETNQALEISMPFLGPRHRHPADRPVRPFDHRQPKRI